jgi:tRNA (guanine37-N1)-methyltransferase
MFESYCGLSIIGRAREQGFLELLHHDLRDWTHDLHRTTDDEPFGGGPGQLMMVAPIFEALDDLVGASIARPPEQTAPAAHVIAMTPTGQQFTNAKAVELSQREHIIILCGRYEGFDERVYTRVDECLSIGDYVLTGGELAAMVVIDAVARQIDGVLGHKDSKVDESFSDGLLEYPQYTRPATYRGLDVPEVLLSGNHANIAKWRREMSIIKTAQFRPDLLPSASLTDEEKDSYDIPRDNP